MMMIVVTAMTGGAVGQGGPPPAAVRADPVRMETVQEHRMVTGELRAVHRARVATEEPSIVLEIPIEEGQAVKKGDLLARLDGTRLDIGLLEIEAQQAVAEATIEERRTDATWRQQDLDNLKRMAAGGAGNPKELYDAEAAVKIANARLIAAEKEVAVIRARAELLRTRQADMRIVAPFDGVIVAKNTEQGEWVEEGAAIVELVSTGPIDVWMDVPQQFADAIIGHSATVQVLIDASGETVETSQLRAIPQVDPKARTFSLIARLPNDKGLLAPGMSVTAMVPTGDNAERLTVSRDAVLRGPTGAYVYVARQTAPDAPPSAMPADVEVLFSFQDRFVVKSNSLAPGDLVITEGNERLFPTAPVIPQVTPAVESTASAGATPQAK
jgi:RND family efflux transporter MFP subunit